MGPVEVLVIGFPGSRFNGAVLPSLLDQVAKGSIAVLDGVLVSKETDGTVTYVEISGADLPEDAAALSALLVESNGLLSDDDIDELAVDLAPGSSAAVLVFEHTWAIAFRDAVVESGGVLLADFRVPAPVVDEVLTAIAAAG